MVHPASHSIDSPGTGRWAMIAWTGVGLGALALAGLFALLLAWSRVPHAQDVFAEPLLFFRKGLVIHVVFSFVVWFLSAFGALSALTNLVAARPGCGSRLASSGGALLAAVALPLLFAGAFAPGVEATLNNYVPALLHPAYYTGLAVLAAGVGLAALAAIRALAGDGRGEDPVGLRAGAAATGFVFLGACVSAGLAWRALAGEPLSFEFNEHLFWAAGHTLQFMNVAMMVAAWAWLARPMVGPEAAGGFRLAAFVAALGGIAGPAVFLATPAFSTAQTLAYTDLQYALPAAPVIAGWALLRSWRTAGFTRRAEPETVAIGLSMALFLIGGALGLFVDGADTRTPAHYHAVIAAVNVALMGAFHCAIVPAAGARRVAGRSVLWQMGLFAVGQGVASLGLFLAGGYGAPRKMAGAEQGLVHSAEFLGLALNGLGALAAAAGGVWFVVSIWRALWRRGARGA